jgi:1-aminocyclopropane-1-carboxylate deaminase
MMLSALGNLDEYAQRVERLQVPFSRIENALTQKKSVRWDMVRLDLLDAELSGNKLFKLLPFLLHAKRHGITQLLSFGGAYSNHLHALAAAGKRFGFSTVGIIRAYVEQEETPTLMDLRSYGMDIRFAGKAEYARRHDKEFLRNLQADYPDALIIPEGGDNALGVQGAHLMARVLARSLPDEPCTIALAMGTGTSFIGLLTSYLLSPQSKLLGYSALNNAEILKQKINRELGDYSGPLPQWTVTDDYCFGGFAKMDKKLSLFMHHFENEQSFVLDPVYTAKLCYALHEEIERGIIPEGSRLVSLHTGGLQGRRGMSNTSVNAGYSYSRELC